MDPRDSEPLLRQLARLPETEAVLPDDEILAAYRRGELPAAEEERLERLLAKSPAARRRLVELADLAASRPGEQVRSRVLASFAQERRGSRRRAGRYGWWTAAAAVLAVALALPWMSRPFRAPLPSYPVHLLGGQAQVRGAAGAPAGSEISAFADQEVRFLVETGPRPEAEESRVELGLFRAARGRLERLDAGGADAGGSNAGGFVAGRDGATLSRRAADLAGPAPGRYPLFLTVARPGDLPQSGEAVAGGTPGEIAAAVADGGRRRVSTLYLTILEDDPSLVQPRGEAP